MRKFLLTIAILTTAFVASAQTMRIHFKNGTKVEFNSENVDFVDFARFFCGGNQLFDSLDFLFDFGICLA